MGLIFDPGVHTKQVCPRGKIATRHLQFNELRLYSCSPTPKLRLYVFEIQGNKSYQLVLPHQKILFLAKVMPVFTVHVRIIIMSSEKWTS